MLKFRSENGKHIVFYDGRDHTFDTIHDAWEYIFIVRVIRRTIRKKVKGY